MDNSNPTDEELAGDVKAGQIERFGLLIERYGPKMKRYARKFLFGYHDAEDLVQDVFFKAYANIRGFDSKRRFGPWLYRIAHNEFLNAIKKRGREPLVLFNTDALFPHPAAPDNPAGDAERAVVRAQLDRCLDRLDPKYREPLILYYFEELDYREIADILRIPPATVGVRLARGRLALKTIYENFFSNERQ